MAGGCRQPVEDWSHLHLVMHLARAGWVRWNDGTRPGRPARGRTHWAARLILDDGTGRDVTEAGIAA